MNDPTDDAELRELLDDAVRHVEPADRLAEIRSRTSARGRRGRYAVGGSVLLAAAAVVTVAVVATPDGATTVDPRDPQPAPTSAAPSPPVAPVDPSAGASDTTARPVYYVGETPNGPELYREYRPLTRAETDDVLRLATTPGSALDPDYRTAWPEPVTDFTFDGLGGSGGFRVVLPGSLADRPEGMAKREAVLAVQQVVHTLQAQADASTPVRFVRPDGQAASTVLGLTTPDGVALRAPSLDVLADVNVFDPGEGLRVQGSFTARGVANSFEATVPWEIRDDSGTVVATYSAMAEGAYDRLYPWETEIDVSDLDPGVYTFVARTDDPSGGEGPGATEDTRTIVVEESDDADAPAARGTAAYFVGPGPDGRDAPAAVPYRTASTSTSTLVDALVAGPTDDPTGGAEGRGTDADTRSITVTG